MKSCASDDDSTELGGGEWADESIWNNCEPVPSHWAFRGLVEMRYLQTQLAVKWFAVWSQMGIIKSWQQV